jgi:hypothetical protein
MKRLILVVGILVGLSPYSFAKNEGHDPAISSAPAVVEWPDYGGDRWPVFREMRHVVVFPHQSSNRYLEGLQVFIGTITYYVDHSTAPHWLVTEYSILGNGVVARVLSPFGKRAIDTQILASGKWISGGANGYYNVYLLDADALVHRGEMIGILLRLNPSDGKLAIDVMLMNQERP